ncbi:MAG: hypothetical protein BRC29_00040 [Nanohaloarchaea archaeon SW_7_43_1]|nr:MAG: hypothetical protein BRC29_00040 [Nanohaloarchaea archaeon SW_7_43_1]
MNSKILQLKIKNYWRKNEKLILAITGAFILGMTIAGLNFLNHENSINKYKSSDTQVIDAQRNANFSFQVDDPSVAQAQIELRLENMDGTPPVRVLVNGQELTEVSANTDLINIPSEQLQAENNVVIETTGLGIDEQRLIYANVTSTNNIQELMFVILNLTSLLLMAAPVMYIKYEQYKTRKNMQKKFPEFLRDVVEGTRAGMSLPQAIKNTETGSYGPLDEKIEKMNAQLDWGIPFEKVLRNFGKDTGSPVIRRSVDTIIQAYSSGGNIQDVLESVGDNIRSIKKLKEKRESQLYGEMITGYVVFFIFIGILVALTEFLLPNLASAQQSLGGGGNFQVIGGGGANLQENISLYNDWFARLVYIQAFFSGLIIGKLSEGELKAGFKHMSILFAAGYLAVTFFL